MLTLAPEDWTIQKALQFFNVSEYAVKQARKFKKEKGILATPSNYYREGLDKETKECVVEFYERDDISCMCPGEKDCVSIRNKDGSKEKVQKRLFWPVFLKYMPILRQNFQVAQCVYAPTIKM